MNNATQGTQNKRAWGQTIAAASELRALMEHARRELIEEIPEDEIRRRTLGRARRDPLAGIRFLFPSLNRKALRASAPFALRALADHFAKKWKNKKVRDGAARVTEALGWDAWLADFILDWAKTGEPGAYLDGFGGGVHTFAPGFEGERVPMVLLIATPASDLDALVEELRAQYQHKMPRASLHSIQDPETRARWFRLFEEGLTDRQIAERQLKADGFEFRAVDEAEYKRELGLMTARVKTGRTRWRKRVTEIVRSV